LAKNWVLALNVIIGNKILVCNKNRSLEILLKRSLIIVKILILRNILEILIKIKIHEAILRIIDLSGFDGERGENAEFLHRVDLIKDILVGHLADFGAVGLEHELEVAPAVAEALPALAVAVLLDEFAVDLFGLGN